MTDLKKMKSVVSGIAVIATVAMILSACGNSGSSGAANKQGSTSKAGDTAKDITLTMIVSGNKAANGQDFELDVLPKMVHEKFPNITLEVQKLPDDQYITSIKTKLAAQEAPDIFRVWPRMGGTSVGELSKAGYLADLTDLPFMSNISAGAKEDMSSDGKIYAVSKGIDMLGTYYNKDLFQKAGITETPQDWESFLAACQKLKDAGITPIVMGDKDPWWIQFGVYQIAANTVYSQEKEFDTKLKAGSQQFTDPKWTKAISMYKELYDKGYIAKNTLGLSGPQATQTFVDGKAAMVFDGTWDFPTLTAKGAVEFERGFFPLPANEQGQPVWQAVSTSAGWAVNAKSENLDSVKQVINYWFDQNSELFKVWANMNPAISAFNSVPLKNELYKESYELYQKSGNSIYFANQMWPNGVSDVLQAKFGEIIGGMGTSPEDVTKSMQSKFDELWKK